MPFWADHAQIAIGLRIAFDLPEPSILHKGNDAATVAASVTKGRDAG